MSELSDRLGKDFNKTPQLQHPFTATLTSSIAVAGNKRIHAGYSPGYDRQRRDKSQIDPVYEPRIVLWYDNIQFSVTVIPIHFFIQLNFFFPTSNGRLLLPGKAGVRIYKGPDGIRGGYRGLEDLEQGQPQCRARISDRGGRKLSLCICHA